MNARPRTLVVLLFASAAPACAAPAGQATAASPSPSDDADLARLETIYRARADSAILEVSQADVDFMSGMIGHHAQALVMSALAPGNGASRAVRTLAARIVNAQTDEIALMQRWLRERGLPVPEVGAGGHMHHAMHMPGMLTSEQLRELEDAQGPEFDRLFLRYMIQHHQGAVIMVHELFATDGAAQDESVFKLASDIQVDQITEVARMQKMLNAMAAPDR